MLHDIIRQLAIPEKNILIKRTAIYICQSLKTQKYK